MQNYRDILGQTQNLKDIECLRWATFCRVPSLALIPLFLQWCFQGKFQKALFYGDILSLCQELSGWITMIFSLSTMAFNLFCVSRYHFLGWWFGVLEISYFRNSRAEFCDFYWLYSSSFKKDSYSFQQRSYLFQLSSYTWLSLAQTTEANLLFLAVLFQLCYSNPWVAACSFLSVW